MTWNGRVTVHDDLSRLHASSRAADTSREIGYSSVTQGEGSLDLLAESGDVRASLGDQPDGRFGVSITHRGSLRFLPDLFTDLEDEDDSLSSRISGLGDRMISAEGRLDAHNARIHDNDGRISGLGDRMVSAEGTLSSHNTRIGNAQDRADSAWTRAGTGIANAATAQARANSAHTRIDNLSYASPGDISGLQSAINSLTSTVSALNTRVAALEAIILP